MRNILLTAAAVSILAGASALAQNTTPATPMASPSAAPMAADQNNSNKNMSNSNAAATPAATPTTNAAATNNDSNKAGNVDLATLQQGDMLSSLVVGLDVYNGQNNNIGKIQDIAFDQQRQVKAYILSVGGFLGMGTHYVAVEPSSVTVRYDANGKVWRANMSATKEQLKATPEFKYQGEWNASRS